SGRLRLFRILIGAQIAVTVLQIAASVRLERTLPPPLLAFVEARSHTSFAGGDLVAVAGTLLLAPLLIVAWIGLFRFSRIGRGLRWLQRRRRWGWQRRIAVEWPWGHDRRRRQRRGGHAGDRGHGRQQQRWHRRQRRQRWLGGPDRRQRRLRRRDRRGWQRRG